MTTEEKKVLERYNFWKEEDSGCCQKSMPSIHCSQCGCSTGCSCSVGCGGGSGPGCGCSSS